MQTQSGYSCPRRWSYPVSLASNSHGEDSYTSPVESIPHSFAVIKIWPRPAGMVRHDATVLTWLATGHWQVEVVLLARNSGLGCQFMANFGSPSILQVANYIDMGANHDYACI